MSPVAASDSIASPGSEAPRRCVERVARDDVDPRHFPPEPGGLYVDISEAESIDVGFRTIRLETHVSPGNAQRCIHVGGMPREFEGHLDPNRVRQGVQIEVDRDT